VSRLKNYVYVGEHYGEQECIQTDLRTPPSAAQLRKGTPGPRAALMRCRCGGERLVNVSNLYHPDKPVQLCQSCARAEDATTHGLSKTPAYQHFLALRAVFRQGTPVFEPWLDAPTFLRFLETQMPPRPDGTRLGRLDHSKGFEPGNIGWMTYAETFAQIREHTS
jgi:hypothetical protein